MIIAAMTLPVAHRQLTRPGAPAVLVSTWAAAIYGCVPETGPLPPALAMVFGLTAWELLGRTALPWQVHYAEVFLIMSMGVFGTAGRPSALVGTLFGIWPLIVVAATSFRRVTQSGSMPRRIEGLAVVGCIGSLVVARTGALAASGITQAALSIAVVIAATVTLASIHAVARAR